jgi:hypothetical protein
MTTTSQPELRGMQTASYDGRYRLYTADHLPYDALPRYRDGGPATVTLEPWSVSYSGLDRMFSSRSVVEADDGQWELHVYRVISQSPYANEKHPLYGTKYPTMDDASRAAYEAGCLGLMIYEKDAAKWGLGQEPIH